MKRKNTSKLDHAVERIAEIVIEHMSTLPVGRDKAMREEIRRLAARRPRQTRGHDASMTMTSTPPERNIC